MINKLNYVLNCENGSSNVEIIVWISVVLVLASVLFIFRNTIANFIDAATGKVSNFQVTNGTDVY